MTVFWLCFLAALAALAGGNLAILNRQKLNLMLGLTAGIILGLVAFDLIPEIARLCQTQNLDLHWPMLALVTGFLAFHIVEKSILIHGAHESEYGEHTHPRVGQAGAAALIGHSFLDGAAIGIAFQAGSTVLVPVAIAVIAHRFADGFNTANLMIVHKNKPQLTQRMIRLAAVMPILGGLIAAKLPTTALPIYLGFFVGFLLYIGASDILPQAHSKGSSRGTIALTVLGSAVMFVISRVV